VTSGRFSNEAEKLSGRLLSEVQFSTIHEILKQGLHEYLDFLQQRFNQIGEALFAVYIFQPFAEFFACDTLQQQQQQQQVRLRPMTQTDASLAPDPL
jgi:A predicted alpha-helical domain with a conserved ER motif.